MHRWAPGDGYLYDLEVQLVDDGGRRCSTATTRASGVRTVAVDGTRFLINGEPFHFTGFGMHEDHGGARQGAQRRAHAARLRAAGVDRRELLPDLALPLLARTSWTTPTAGASSSSTRPPRSGMNMGLGGGIFGAQGYTTFSPRRSTSETREVHAQAIRELVARDKNHPSVVLWSIANEPESDTEGAERYFEPLFELTRELDPTRPVGFVNVMLAPYGKCRVSQFGDVLMLNRYYGWYVDTGDLAAAERAWEEELRGWASEGKPIIITEYGADTYPGLHAVPPHAVDRGVPGGLPGDEPPGVRPDRRGGRRAGVELRRLRDDRRDHARRRQQEGRVHPRPPAQGGRVGAAPPLARREVTVGSADPGLVVAVDIGTTGVKAAAVDVAAVTHADAEREYPTERPDPGWSVQDPEAVVDGRGGGRPRGHGRRHRGGPSGRRDRLLVGHPRPAQSRKGTELDLSVALGAVRGWRPDRQVPPRNRPAFDRGRR